MFIHGGGYMSGGSSWHGPDLLLDEDIVLVTINYRLGPFGFLSLNTPEYSGNMGLKDQRLALKWVNENIEFFGGKHFKLESIFCSLSLSLYLSVRVFFLFDN